MPDAGVNAELGNATSVVGALVNVDNDTKNSMGKDENDAQTVLLNLPQRELQLLCLLLAKDGYAFYISLAS